MEEGKMTTNYTMHTSKLAQKITIHSPYLFVKEKKNKIKINEGTLNLCAAARGNGIQNSSEVVMAVLRLKDRYQALTVKCHPKRKVCCNDFVVLLGEISTNPRFGLYDNKFFP